MTKGHDEAEGYAASLRQMAQWVDEFNENPGHYNNIGLEDIDTEELRAAAAFIDRVRAPAARAPNGWKLVPIEPTEAMVEIGCDNNPTSWNEGTDDGFAADVANDVYVSMVRAAPAAPSFDKPAATPPDPELADIVKQADWYADMDANAGLAFHLAKHWPKIRAALSQCFDRTAVADKMDYKIGWWLSAALEDPNVCAEMKADINAWFEAHQPGLVMEHCTCGGSVGQPTEHHDISCPLSVPRAASEVKRT